MDEMITTSNTKLPVRKHDGIKEETQEDGTVVLVSTKPLKTIQTGNVKPRTRLEGKEPKNYYPPLTTSLLHKFKRTKRGKQERDKHLEIEADKKRVAEGVPPVLSQNKK